MKLLFTGASGFLGRNIYQLLEKTYVIKTVGLTPQDGGIRFVSSADDCIR